MVWARLRFTSDKLESIEQTKATCKGLSHTKPYYILNTPFRKCEDHKPVDSQDSSLANAVSLNVYLKDPRQRQSLEQRDSSNHMWLLAML